MGELRLSLSNKEFVGWEMYYARLAQREELASLMAQHKRK